MSAIGTLLECNKGIKSSMGNVWHALQGRIDNRMVATSGMRKAMGIETVHAGEGAYKMGSKELDLSTGSFRDDVSNWDRVRSLYKNDDGSVNKSMWGGTAAGLAGTAIAGSYIMGGDD